MEFCVYRSNIDVLSSRCHCSNKMIKVPDGKIPLSVCLDCPWASRVMNESMLRKSGENVIAPNPNFQPPSVIDMGVSFISSTVKHVVNGAKAVSEEVYKERLNICNSCEHREGIGCKLCHCNLPRKAKRPLEACPIGKWKEVP